MVVRWADDGELGKTAFRKILVGKKKIGLREGRSLWTSPKIRTILDKKTSTERLDSWICQLPRQLFPCVLPSVFKFSSVRQISLPPAPYNYSFLMAYIQNHVERGVNVFRFPVTYLRTEQLCGRTITPFIRAARHVTWGVKVTCARRRGFDSQSVYSLSHVPSSNVSPLTLWTGTGKSFWLTKMAGICAWQITSI
jgi:hypothetical protein